MNKILIQARNAVHRANNRVFFATLELREAELALKLDNLEPCMFTEENYTTDLPWIFIEDLSLPEQVRLVKQGIILTDGKLVNTQHCVDWIKINRDEIVSYLK